MYAGEKWFSRGGGAWYFYKFISPGIKDEADLEEYNDYLLDPGDDDDGEEGMDLFKIEDLEDEHDVDDAKFTHTEFKENL